MSRTGGVPFGRRLTCPKKASLLSPMTACTSGRPVTASVTDRSVCHEVWPPDTENAALACMWRACSRLPPVLRIVRVSAAWGRDDWTQNVYIISFICRLKRDCFHTLSSIPILVLLCLFGVEFLVSSSRWNLGRCWGKWNECHIRLARWLRQPEMLVVHSLGSASLSLPAKCAGPLWQLLSQTSWGHRVWTTCCVVYTDLVSEPPLTDINAKCWGALRHSLSNRWRERKAQEQGCIVSDIRRAVDGIWQLPADPHTSGCESVKILDESNEKGEEVSFAANALRKESNADLMSMNAVWSGLSNSRCSSVRSRNVRIASAVDRLYTREAGLVWANLTAEKSALEHVCKSLAEDCAIPL